MDRSLKLDTWRRLEGDAGVFPAHVVGIVAGDPGLVASPQGQRFQSRQTSNSAALRLAGSPRAPSDARLVLHRSADRASFLHDWRPRLAAYPGRLELWDRASLDVAARNSPGAEGTRLAVMSAAIVAAACVVCVTLGVQGSAVRERASQYALLQALGAGRGTLAGVILGEAMMLTMVALVGAVALTWGVMTVIGIAMPFIGISGAPSIASIAITGTVILAGALLGAAWPAWVAGRSSPAESAARQSDPRRAWTIGLRAAAAAIVVAVVVIGGITLLPENSLLRARFAAWVGVPALGLIAVCMTPLSIQVIGRTFGRPLALLTRTDSSVLANHLAGAGGRNTGAVLAISVGLGGFVWLLCWGYSMLGAFVIDPLLPRWLVSVHPYGIDRDETEKLMSIPELASFQPLTLIDTRIATQHNDDVPVPTLVMGIDVQRSLADLTSALPFRFVDGDRAQAAKALSDGGQCLVGDWYAASTGFGVGDQISVAVPGSDGRTERTYKIAGVVDLRGWRMVTKQNKVRLRGDKHQAMVVLSADTVRRDFSVAYANFLIGDTFTGADHRVTCFRGDLPDDEALAESIASRQAIEAAASQTIDLNRTVSHQPDGGATVQATGRVVQADDLDRTRARLLGDWGGGAVKRMAQIPLIALGLSLSSLSGALVVSFRSQARELGILRSCGLTRFGLARLCLAEGLVLGLAAVPVSAIIGAGGAWLMLEVARVVGWRLDFAGIQPEFAVPWGWMWPGVALTTLVVCIAALIAAWRVGRIVPASLVSGAADLR